VVHSGSARIVRAANVDNRGFELLSLLLLSCRDDVDLIWVRVEVSGWSEKAAAWSGEYDRHSRAAVGRIERLWRGIVFIVGVLYYLGLSEEKYEGRKRKREEMKIRKVAILFISLVLPFEDKSVLRKIYCIFLKRRFQTGTSKAHS
jgi:hypothetical protein